MKVLPRFSYSKMSTFTQCPMKFDLKYNQGNYEQAEAIHLDLGSILHKVLEIKYRNIIERKQIDYNDLKTILQEGIAEETDKDKGNFIIGINSIKEKYGEEIFNTTDPKSDLSYNEKLYIFNEYLEEDELGNSWRPYVVEQHFEFEYENKVILNGFIDRIDINNQGDLRVVDYKSSNKGFRDSDLKTPLQMIFYALACEKLFGKTPIEYQYDLILLGEKQVACSKGYYNRGVKKINKILDEIEWSEATGDWIPKPTPLCHWCSFSESNPNADWYSQSLCEYYSLWTPDNKTFTKNKDYK